MPISDESKKHLNRIFDPVGNEGDRNQVAAIDYSNIIIEVLPDEESSIQEEAESVEIETASVDKVTEQTEEIAEEIAEQEEESTEAVEADDDILNLLDDRPSSDDESILDDEPDDDDFDFLDVSEKKSSRFAKKTEDEENKEEVIPVKSHTVSETMAHFNTGLSDEAVKTLLKGIGEDIEDNGTETNYLEEQQNKNSRLMSRVKQKEKEEDIVPVKSHTIGDSIQFFNESLTAEAIKTLLNDVGDVESSGESSENFLDEQQKKNSRLMSRVKQQEEAANQAPVKSHVVPDKTAFDFNLKPSILKELLKSVGEIE